MAKPEDIVSDLTLEIDGQVVTPAKFMKGLRAFFTLVNEVAGSVGSEDADWTVRVSTGSNLVGMDLVAGTATPQHLNAIVDRVSASIEGIEREAVEPEGLTHKALNSLRDLGSIVGTTDADDTSVRVWTRKKSNPVSAHSVANVAEVMQGGFTDYGTIEGRIQVLSERGSLHLQIYEPVWDRPIRCHIDEELLNKSTDQFRHRVEVYGKIRYRRDGTPISIVAEEIETFPDRNDLPQFEDIRGILKEYN